MLIFQGKFMDQLGRKFLQKSAVKQKGREKKGPPDIAPKSFSLKRPKMVLCSFHGSHREICIRNRRLSETKFLDDLWGPFLSRPLCFTVEERPSSRYRYEDSISQLGHDSLGLQAHTLPGASRDLSGVTRGCSEGN